MKKKIALLIAFAVCGSMIGGCGASAEKTTEVNAETETKEKEVTEGDNSGKIHLSVWSGEEDEQLMALIADNFIAEHADEATITIEWTAMDEGDCRSNLLTDILNGPDVYTTTDGDISTLVAGGAAAEVTNPEEIIQNNLEASVEAVTINDKIYGYPLTADNGYFLYYNKAYFSDSDVQNLNTMLDIAAASGKKIAMDWSSGWYLYSFFGQTGLEVGLNSDGVTNYCDWNSTENAIKGVDVANAMLEIATNPGFASMSQSEWDEGVKSGEVIACISGVWDETTMKEAWQDSYAACKLPTYNCAGTQVQMACFFGYKTVGVNPYSEHLEWAQKFADYIANEENQKLRFEMRGQGPSNLNAADSPEVQATAAIQAVLAQSEFSELQRIGNNYWTPTATYGNTLATGNPDGIDLQELLDSTVESIVSSTVQ